MARHDEVLGCSFRHQLCPRGRDRHHDGVPVRHELGLLFALCGRRIRRSAGHRGADGLLPRSDLRWALLLRLGPAFGSRASGRDLADGAWNKLLCALDPDRQRMDAEPVGSAFNPDTMRMEVTDFEAVLLNPVAQAKFVHTVSAGYLCGGRSLCSAFRLGTCCGGVISNSPSAHLSLLPAFGLAAALSVIVLGDESGYDLTSNQKMKLAAIEAMWETEPAPASFTVFGIPSRTLHLTRFALRAPWVMGIVGTRSLDRQIPGIEQIVAEDEKRIRAGIGAYDALEKLKANRSDAAARAAFDASSKDLGYGLLLKQYVDDPRQASEQQIKDAAWSTVPNIPSLFFAFRLMVLCAFVLLAVFAISLWHTAREAHVPRWLLRLAILVLPLPWIAVELGWFVAEFGRQPWIIDGVLPTFLATSQLGVWNLLDHDLGLYAGLRGAGGYRSSADARRDSERSGSRRHPRRHGD